MKFHQTIIVILPLIFGSSCTSESSNSKDNNVQSPQSKIEKRKDSLQVKPMDAETIKAVSSLVDIQTINSKILVDLKYATNDNFMKEVLYDTLKKAYLQKDVAVRLGACQNYLSRLKPGYRLLVYDALRPRSIQAKMWKALDTIPVRNRGKFVSNPANGSVHNYGAAVDVTICDENGIPLDMGAGYDDIRTIAYPSMEGRYLSSGDLKSIHVQNRQLLRKVMRRGRFINIPTEWWHFNAYPRLIVKRKYLIVE
jgi:zinc D-Ala-D-Ala dipeptidase